MPMRAVIFAAGVGRRLEADFVGPKCLLPVGGMPLVERHLLALREHRIAEVLLVLGYRGERVVECVRALRGIPPVRFIQNPDYEQGSILSLWCARDALEDDVIIMDSDVYFESEVLRRLIRSPHEDVILVDTTVTGLGEEYMAGLREGRVLELGRRLKGDYPLVGEYVGFTRLSAATAFRVGTLLAETVAAGRLDLGYEAPLERHVAQTPMPYEPVDGLRWIEIDFPEDVERARVLARAGDDA